MKGYFVSMLAVATALGALPVAAQNGGNRTAITPYTGYMIFGDIMRGPVGTTLANANGATVGAQLAVPIAGPLSLYGNAAFARSDLTVGVPILGGLTIGSTDAWMFDGGLELRIPASGALTPVLQAGAGVTRYSISNRLVSTEATNATGVLGAGFDVAITPSVGLRFMARDHIGKFDFKEAVFADIEGRTSHHVGLVAGLRLAF